MSIVNQIASFGKGGARGEGSGLAYGNQAAKLRADNQYRNKMMEIEQQRLDQSNALAAEREERQYGAGWAKAYFSAPEDKRGLILRGGAQDAIGRGYISPDEAAGLDESYMYRLAAASGLDFAQKDGGLSNFYQTNDGLIAYNKSTNSMVPVSGGQGVDWKNNKAYKSFQPEQFMDESGAVAWGVPQVAPDGSVSMKKLDGLTPVKEDKGLSPTVQKILDKAQTDYFDSDRKSREFEVVANDILKSSDMFGGGLKAKWTESYKDMTGNQDAITELRRSFYGVRASQAVSNLPPGVASDKDIQLALSGFPTENANGQQVASFLKGMAKLERLKAEFNSFKSGMLSETGSTKNLINEWKVHAETLGIYGDKSQGAGVIDAAAPEGFTLMQDANGNKAYVGPNGEIKEVR